MELVVMTCHGVTSLYQSGDVLPREDFLQRALANPDILPFLNNLLEDNIRITATGALYTMTQGRVTLRDILARMDDVCLESSGLEFYWSRHEE
jgi:hypothetical protein